MTILRPSNVRVISASHLHSPCHISLISVLDSCCPCYISFMSVLHLYRPSRPSVIMLRLHNTQIWHGRLIFWSVADNVADLCEQCAGMQHGHDTNSTWMFKDTRRTIRMQYRHETTMTRTTRIQYGYATDMTRPTRLWRGYNMEMTQTLDRGIETLIDSAANYPCAIWSPEIIRYKYGLSQWEMAFLYNIRSHWLSPYPLSMDIALFLPQSHMNSQYPANVNIN